MRILVHDYAGHPFQAQLSRELAGRGHTVRHAYRSKLGGRGGALERLAADPYGLSFTAIRLGPRASDRRGVLHRLRHELIYGQAASQVVNDFRPDVVISSNTPLLIQRGLLRASHTIRSGFVYWMQDRISVSQTRKLRRRYGVLAAPAATALRELERSSLIGSDAVVAVTPAFVDLLRGYGVAPERVTVIANWAPLDEIVQVPRTNDWGTEHGLADRFVFLYAGSLGLKHDPQMLVELAWALPDAVVVVVAEGAGSQLAKTEAARRGLTNLVVVPSQTYERLSHVLGTADVLVAILDREGAEYSVPSKVLSYLCAGRPILASVPHANLAAQVILELGGGVVIEPGAADDWLDAARRLVRDEQLRRTLARKGRDYAERTFEIRRVADRFEEVLGKVRK